MAYSSSTGMPKSAVERIEKQRRRKEELQEPKVKTPSFNEPRKLSSTNPDHLTKEIRNVLGPMEKISKVIANNPNDWLGTSRSSSCKPSTNSTPGCNPRSRGTNRNEGSSSNVSQQPSHHPPSNNGRFETCPRPGSSENELNSRFLPTSHKPPKSDPHSGFQHNIESSGSNRSSTCPPNKNEAYSVQSTPPANDIAFARNVSNETPGLKTNKDTSFSTSAPMLKGKNTAEENCDGDDSQPADLGSVVGLILDLFDVPTFKSRLFTDDAPKPMHAVKSKKELTTAHGDRTDVDKDVEHLHKVPHVGSSSVTKSYVDNLRNANYDAESDSDSSDDEEVDNEQCDDSATESSDKTNSQWILHNWALDHGSEVAPTATDKRRDAKKDVAASTTTETESINEAPCTETDMEANNKPVLPSSYHRHAPEVVDKPNKHHTSEGLNSDSSRHRFSPAPGKRPSSTNHHHQELQQHRTPTKYSNINGGSSGSQQTTPRSLRAEKPSGSSSRSHHHHHRNNQHQSSTNDAAPSRTSSSHNKRSEYDRGSSNSSSHSSSRSRRPMVKDISDVAAKGAASSPVTVPPPITKTQKGRGSKNNADSKPVVSGKPSKNVSTINSGRSPYTGKEQRSKTHLRGRTAKREAPVTIEQEIKRSDSENSLSTSSSGEDSDHKEAVQSRQAVMPPTISDRYQSSMSSPNKPPSASSRHGSAVRSSHELKETAATASRHCEEVRALSRQDSSSSIASYSLWKRKDGNSSSKPKKRPATNLNADDSTSLRERTDGSKYSDRSSSKELPYKKRRETSKPSKERSRRESSGREQKTIKSAREALFHPLIICVTTTTDCDSKRRSKPGSESSRRRKHENGGEAHRDASRRSTKSSPPRKNRITGAAEAGGGASYMLPISQSTGSETDKPLRRARDVRVCPASTSDISHLGKHKHNSPPGLLEHPSSSYSGRRQPFDPADGVPLSKRAKTLTNEENASRRAGNGLWMGDTPDDVSQFRESRRDHTNGEQSGGTVQVWSAGSHVQPQENRSENDKMVLICQTRPNTIVSEPDSSWPEQERLRNSDQYMDEGKRLKHVADRYFDVNTYRSPIDILRRGLIYFEASLMFTMNGHMIEVENEKSNESGGSSSSSSLSPSSMYDQTIPLFEHIRKLNNGDQQHAADFRRLTVSCLRAEALLHLRIFNLKKESASKNLEQLQEQFKQARVAANNRTPSPWRANGQTNQQQQQGVGNNIVSPISPAVPSPYGSINAPGPSPAAGSTCSSGTSEHVSSSTQVAGAFLAFPVKAYENFKSYHQIVHHLVVAHQHWDEAQRQQDEDKDFFKDVGVMAELTLTLHSSLRDMVAYLKVVLHRMRVKSPKE